ncbi:MAG: hypothetical protein PHN88_15470 [Ignavibacteria bacterium]|nr:hypothetical protein [Ignavibacteria bacterium]
MNSQNIFWTFSTAAQAIAAFIGFLTAGFFFVYEKIASQSEADETLLEIIEELLKSYHSKIKTLIYLTGLTIMFCLFITFINGFNWRIEMALVIICSILIIITIIWASFFVITITDPSNIKKTARRITIKDKSLFDIKNESTESVSEFLRKFLELEKRLRKLAEENDMPMNYRSVPLIKYIDYLETIHKITLIQFRVISELIRTRNVAVHTQSEFIDKRLIKSLDNLLIDIKT